MTIKLIRDFEKNFGRKKSRNVRCRGPLKFLFCLKGKDIQQLSSKAFIEEGDSWKGWTV